MNCVLFAKIDQVFSLGNRALKIYWKNGKKYWKSQGILSVQKSGNPGMKSENVQGLFTCFNKRVQISAWRGLS